MRMSITDCVHSFYAADSCEPLELRTLLFLDYDPVLPGWPPEEAAEAERTNHQKGGVTCKSDNNNPRSSSRAWASAIG
jgi:hypothetical protein